MERQNGGPVAHLVQFTDAAFADIYTSIRKSIYTVLSDKSGHGDALRQRLCDWATGAGYVLSITPKHFLTTANRSSLQHRAVNDATDIDIDLSKY